MGGIRNICRFYGGMTVRGQDGKTVKYLWDYDRDEPVTEEEMKDRERFAKSERAKWKAAARELRGNLFDKKTAN